MSLPTSKNSYLDCIEYLDRAMAETKGARIKIGSYDEGIRLRMRMHQLRAILRRDTKLIYSIGDPGYDTTEYDCLTLTVDLIAEQWYVVMKKNEIRVDAIEPIPDDPRQIESQLDDFVDAAYEEVPDQIQYTPMKLLPMRRLL